MEWRIGLEAYEVMAVHGFYDEEHKSPQPFVVTLWATLVSKERIERLDDTLNYADLQTAVDRVLLNAPEPIRLMEEMAQHIIDLLSPNPALASLSVRIEKPQAPLPHPGGLPVIEVLWQRS